MHEMSIALEVCRIVEERVGREALAEVLTVGVEVGDGSGVEPESLRFWLEVLLEGDPFAGARPVLERRPGDVLAVSYLEVDDAGPEDRGPGAGHGPERRAGRGGPQAPGRA